MTLELTDEEYALVTRLVEREVAELGPEIRHTDTRSFRDELKARKRTLRHLLDRLHMVHTA